MLLLLLVDCAAGRRAITGFASKGFQLYEKTQSQPTGKLTLPRDAPSLVAVVQLARETTWGASSGESVCT